MTPKIIFLGCLIVVAIVAVTQSRPSAAPPFVRFHETSRIVKQGSTPRRPLPTGALPVYYESAELSGSRQGTAFAIDPRGSWATAAHVTDRCREVYLLANQRRGLSLRAPTRALGNDISLLAGASRAPTGLQLARHPPLHGAIGYHMGFPMGSPGLIGSRLLGETRTVRRNGREERVLAWVEEWRTQRNDEALDGLSGAPVLNDDAEVVGIVSMATERRGRILSALPGGLRRLMVEARIGVDQRYKAPLTGRQSAVARFQLFLSGGLIRQVYCDI